MRPCSSENAAGLRRRPNRCAVRARAPPHPCAVEPLVGLRPRRPHRRAAAAVEQLELDAGRVDRPPHQPAERVDLAHEMALRRAANRRIAGHVRHRVPRQRAERRPCSPGARPQKPPHTRVPGADHDDVELSRAHVLQLLADAELGEDVHEQSSGGPLTGDLLEPAREPRADRKHELFGQCPPSRPRRARRRRVARARAARCAGCW